MNEKEDLAAMHQNNAKVKTHLIQRVNELDKSHIEKSTELLFTKRQLQSLESEKSHYDTRWEAQKKEVEVYRERVGREGRVLRERVGRLTEENLRYQKAIEDMKKFFDKLKQ